MTIEQVSAGAAIDPIAFRNALGCFPTGVAIITTLDASGQAAGLTCNSFSSVSLDPPLVAWSLRLASKSIDIFRAADGFAINILHDDQTELSSRFASSTRTDKFDGVAWAPGHLGSPVIVGAVSNFQCSTFARHVAGDHVLFIGEVKAFSHSEQEPSLVFYRGRYMALTQSLREMSKDGRIRPEQLSVAREALHELLLRLACDHGTEDDFRAIEANIVQMEGMAPDNMQPRSANAREFFDLIAKAAHNEVLCVVAASLSTLLQLTLSTRLPYVARPELLPMRRRILDGLRTRDASASVNAMSDYFNVFGEALQPIPDFEFAL
jgi:flavin reductase (DIM6/NTAB) family NADH-FMN oxidoreductase RutF